MYRKGFCVKAVSISNGNILGQRIYLPWVKGSKKSCLQCHCRTRSWPEGY